MKLHRCLCLLSFLLLSACASDSWVSDSAAESSPEAAEKSTTEPVKRREMMRMPMAAERNTHRVIIVATVPEDAPPVFVSGNLPALGPWHPAGLAMKGTGTRRTAEIAVPHGHNLQYKITAGSWEQEGLGPSATLLPAFTATVNAPVQLTADIAGFRKDPKELIADWQGSGVEGTLVYWNDMPSAFLNEKRHVVTWLPPGYEQDTSTTYKVIYMHDGQNLFDPRLSYTNVDWGVDEAMMAGVRAGKYEPAIIVGIWNTPDRLKEYSPDHLAPSYSRFILEELMPKVASTYRVKTGPENTFSMGSSMGGLVSFHLVRNHPDVFSACGCVSTHVTWSEQQLAGFNGADPTQANPVPFILRSFNDSARMPEGQRIYLDYGTEGLDAYYDVTTRAVAEWLETQGYSEGDDLKVKQFEGAGHNEAAWRARVGEQLEWLLSTP